MTTGPDKGVVVANDRPNTVLTSLDLSANVMTDKGYLPSETLRL